MLSHATLVAIFFALAEARFGQEQLPIAAIAAIQGGDAGVAQTIAGAAISDLLGGANPCAKLQRADQILAELGTGADAVAAAIGLVAAEKNFNPFNAQALPSICSDATLPANELLRGITPLIDPAVNSADVANDLSAQTIANPLDAAGKSIADLLEENGFTDFIAQAADGVAAAAAAGDNAKAGNNAEANADAAECAATVTVTVTEAAAAATGAAGTKAEADDADAEAGDAAAAAVELSTIAGLDFGQCVPTIKFEGGLGGRPDTEFTFLPIDSLVAQGQQEALNPNIITNRICDQLGNVCDANDAAIAACEDAQAQILALNTREKSTADTWNELLGFAGTITNPDGGDAEPAAAVRRRMTTHRWQA